MPIDRDRLAKVRADVARLTAAGLSRRNIARKLGISTSAAQRAQEWHKSHNPHESGTKAHVEFGADNTGSVVTESFAPQTVEDAAEKGGLDLSRYEITGGRLSAYPVTVKQFHDDGTTTAETVHQWGIQAKFRARSVAPDLVWAAILEDVRRAPPPVCRKPLRGDGSEDLLLEIGTPDLHVGKMAVGGGAIEVAYNRAMAATAHFLTKADRPGRILLPIGNDLLNCDTAQGTTTKGTRQDNLADPRDIFTEARRLIEDQVGMCAQVAPVDVVVVAGNHDVLASWHLAHVIDARFHNSERVCVRLDTVRRRAYYHWGRVLLGYVHGDKACPKIEALGQLMAEEQPEAWHKSVWREWHIGHRHSEIVRNANTVRLRWWPSLSVTDGWTYDHGYREPPEAQAILWHREHGYDAGFVYRPKV